MYVSANVNITRIPLGKFKLLFQKIA